MKKALKIIGIVLVLGFIASCGGDRGYLLSFTPEEGDHYDFNFSVSMTGLYIGLGATYDILSINNNEIDIAMEFTSMSMDMNISGESMSYDSRNPGGSLYGELMHEQLEPFFSARLEQKMSDRGKIIKAPDFESIFSDNPAMQEQMGGMNKQMESMFVEYPEEALKIGDSFDVQLDNEGMSIAAVYTLTGVTVTEYILSVNGDISSSDELPVTGTMKGTFNLFRECGMVMSGDLTMEMEALGENITIKMLMESTKS